MAGLAAEGLQYDKVVGQSADLFSLQVYNPSPMIEFLSDITWHTPTNHWCFYFYLFSVARDLSIGANHRLAKISNKILLDGL